VEIPTDDHIHEGGVLDRAQMAKRTRRAGLAAAAAVADLMVAVAERPPARPGS
jgi:hypothetical protein